MNCKLLALRNGGCGVLIPVVFMVVGETFGLFGGLLVCRGLVG